jgi:hypothetical protein
MARTTRFLAILACLAFAHVASAQTRGTINGVITDEDGIGVPGVIVTAHGVDQAELFKTSSDGKYVLENLVPGRYVITAALDGYVTGVRSGVMVRSGRTANRSFVMKILRTSETVTVRAPMPKQQTSVQPDRQTSELVLPAHNPFAATGALLERTDAIQP